MNNRQHDITSISHTAETIAELREDHDFAVEYLKAALEELDHPDHRAAGLLALRDVAEAYGGIAAVAAAAGISREALYRALAPGKSDAQDAAGRAACRRHAAIRGAGGRGAEGLTPRHRRPPRVLSGSGIPRPPDRSCR